MAHTVNRIPEPLIAELERAYTLPANFYVDPTLLEDEKRRIFHKTWQIVGRSEQVANPGDFFTLDLLGEPLLITHGEKAARLL